MILSFENSYLTRAGRGVIARGVTLGGRFSVGGAVGNVVARRQLLRSTGQPQRDAGGRRRASGIQRRRKMVKAARARPPRSDPLPGTPPPCASPPCLESRCACARRLGAEEKPLYALDCTRVAVLPPAGLGASQPPPTRHSLPTQPPPPPRSCRLQSNDSPAVTVAVSLLSETAKALSEATVTQGASLPLIGRLRHSGNAAKKRLSYGAVQFTPLTHPFTHALARQRRSAAARGPDRLVSSASGSGTLRRARGGIEPATLRPPDDGSHILSRIAPTT